MDVASVISTVDDLLTRPYPAEFVRAHGDDGVESGPGYHLAVLARSEDFWEDSDYSRMQQVEAEFDAAAERLAAALAARYDVPQRITIDWDDDAAPPAEARISSEVVDAYRWERGDRALYVAVGKQDKELPFELLVAVGSTRHA